MIICIIIKIMASVCFCWVHQLISYFQSLMGRLSLRKRKTYSVVGNYGGLFRLDPDWPHREVLDWPPGGWVIILNIKKVRMLIWRSSEINQPLFLPTFFLIHRYIHALVLCKTIHVISHQAPLWRRSSALHSLRECWLGCFVGLGLSKNTSACMRQRICYCANFHCILLSNL